MSALKDIAAEVASTHTLRWEGKVMDASVTLIESEGPNCSVGDVCEYTHSSGQRSEGEVIGFRGKRVLSVPLQGSEGIGYGDRITTIRRRPTIRVGEEMIGRVLDANGQAIDGRIEPFLSSRVLVDAVGPDPMSREPIRNALQTGVRAIDSCLTCGQGQRVGIFGGSGVGKSTLVGIMTRNTSADLTVVALVGERGREVREFLEDSLGEVGREKSITVVSTSDQSPLLRMRAAMTATSIAEFFCRRGKNVLLVVDSLTRFCMAQREIGLAAGEPPTARGYPPSVFSKLARLLERAGNFGSGSITGFYSVLMEGDDQQDPIVDSVRSILDGHIILDRDLASEGHYPPIQVVDSISRLMPVVVDANQLSMARELRKLLAAYRKSEDLIRVGAYIKGVDNLLDRAITLLPSIRKFLSQEASEQVSIESARIDLRDILAI